MKPSSTPYVTKGEFYDAEMFQGLLEIGECPEGTIPVRRAREDEDYSQRAMPLVPRRKDLNIIDNPAIQHEVIYIILPYEYCFHVCYHDKLIKLNYFLFCTYLKLVCSSFCERWPLPRSTRIY